MVYERVRKGERTTKEGGNEQNVRGELVPSGRSRGGRGHLGLEGSLPVDVLKHDYLRGPRVLVSCPPGLDKPSSLNFEVNGQRDLF